MNADDKFRKLLAAYEDDVQRKQHKMGKKVEPRDEVQPSPVTGYCSFLRGQQVVWNPSFDVIGTFEPATMRWTWGWAEQTLEAKVRTRIDGVRKQGAEWGIELLTNGIFQLENEHDAWELSTVATAVVRADGMYRFVDGARTRFLALFDGPPPSRSVSMRPPGQRSDSTRMPSVSPPLSTPLPQRLMTPTGQRVMTPPPGAVRMHPAALGRSPSGSVLTATGAMAATGSTRTSSPSSPVAAPTASIDEPEPTAQTRAEIGQRMVETLNFAQQAQLGALDGVVRAQPPGGPVGAVAIDLRLTLRPASGEPGINVTPSTPLLDALAALWLRTRDRNGAPYRFATLRVEMTPAGLVTHASLER